MAKLTEPLLHGTQLGTLSERVGSLAQVARVDSFVVDNGPSRGSRRVRMVTGGGLEIELLPDRALDIGHITYKGLGLSWVSQVGFTSPHSSDATGTEWLRSFGGGLLATCGLNTFGPPSEDEHEHFPMHGRIGTIPSEITHTSLTDGVLSVEGVIRQAKVFGENLVLRRKISADIGASIVHIRDTVTNESAAPSGHMFLYHFNIGWPLLSEKSALSIPSRSTTPRDQDAIEGLDRWNVVEPPQKGFREQVYLHEFDTEAVTVALDNPAQNTRLEISFNTRELPAMFQWKMADHGHYVMGLEPANVGHISGRRSAREQGVLPILEPGQSASYAIDLAVSGSKS